MRHKQIIQSYLNGGQVGDTSLWLAVGYYLCGNGREHDRSFATPDQWRELAKKTRRPIPDNI